MPDPVQGVNPAGALGVDAGGSATGGGATNRAEAEAGVPPGGVDSADVAQAEALLAAIDTAAGTVPAIDQARIAQIQQAIAAGTYQVNAQALAQKLIEIERLLGGAAPTGQ